LKNSSFLNERATEWSEDSAICLAACCPVAYLIIGHLINPYYFSNN